MLTNSVKSVPPGLDRIFIVKIFNILLKCCAMGFVKHYCTFDSDKFGLAE